MKIALRYTKHALKDLKKLEKLTAQKVTKKIEYFSRQDNPLIFAKKLNPPVEDLYRFRIGEYRAIFKSDKRNRLIVLTIIKIGHRKDMYS